MASGGQASGIKDIIDWVNGEFNKKLEVKPVDISEMSGMTLEEAEKSIRNLKKERLIIFDKNGKLIKAYDGEEDRVPIPPYSIYYKDATVTHNHPLRLSKYGGTFSFKDMNNMLDGNWKEHRITASGKGEMNYILRRGENPRPRAFKRRLNRDKKSLEKQMREETVNALREHRNEPNPLRIARQKATGILNKYYKTVAPEYGYEYITRKKDYKYNR